MACFHLWTGTGFQDQHLALVLQCFGQELVALVEIRKDQCGVKVKLKTLELIRVQVVCVGELLSPVHKDDVREFVLSQAGTGPEGKVIGQVDPVDDQLEGTPLSRHFLGIARHPDEGPVVVFLGFSGWGQDVVPGQELGICSGSGIREYRNFAPSCCFDLKFNFKGRSGKKRGNCDCGYFKGGRGDFVISLTIGQRFRTIAFALDHF